MAPLLLKGALAALLAAAVLLVPFGLPGLWIQVALLCVGAVAGWIAWITVGGLAGVAVLAEIAELMVVRALGRRYGGSRKAFWGALAGGFLGMFVGVPVPVVGPLLTAFAGTFLGAGVVTWLETRSLGKASRVGWGVLLGRSAAVGLKVGAAVVVLVAGIGALLF